MTNTDPFTVPSTVSGLERAFGGSMDKLLPPWDDIPDDFKKGSNKWNKLVSRWFFSGLPKETEFEPKDGVDASAAIGHVQAILASFEPKHEHKEAGCAYLLSKWFKDIRVP